MKGVFAIPVKNILVLLVNIYAYIILGRIILSFMVSSQDPGDNAFMANLYRFLWKITEPLLKPLRGLIPSMRSGGGIQLDFSPVIAFLLLHLVRYIIETWVHI
ncbi:MAG: YggT family protein [Firmicutes bacterium]|nr:YggT family protein [Bacillota bacterium]